MSLYQRDDDKWVYSPTGLASDEVVFDTRLEVGVTMSKLQWANEAKGKAAQLAQLADEVQNLYTVYFDRGYNSDGANAIVDSDVESTGNTAAELGGFATMAEQLDKWINGQAVTSIDHDQVLNKLRSDV